ncbi:MAG: protoporphyrinogen oxidase, partial [Geopsychrobacter sp.]|nr:protoporphyrinogen oxidase [Geopsychrobacter sp.]
EVRTESCVTKIEAKQGGFLLHLDDATQVEAEMVVSAAPAHSLSGMVEELDGEAAELLKQIPYASMNVVCFGYQRDKIARDLAGFGYLIAKGEKRNTLGTLWDSSIFPNRAPRGQVLLRSMFGGATNPQAIDLSEDEVRHKTMVDLKKIMGIEADPDFVKIFRHQQAIPQYVPGHGERLAALNERIDKVPGLFLTGNAFFGVGINDCVNASNLMAEKVIAAIQKRAEV